MGGKTCFLHKGNEYFRSIIDAKLEQYSKMNKKEKSEELSQIVERIRSKGGDFVKKNPENNLWFRADDALARDKTSQAFRNVLKAIRVKEKKKKENENINTSFGFTNNNNNNINNNVIDPTSSNNTN